MTESDIAAIRDALAADDLTHGEWVACGPSFGDPLPRYLNEVLRPDDADSGDVVAQAPAGGFEHSADMAYIATVHPERIARLLDALEQATKDAERYRWLRADMSLSDWKSAVDAVSRLCDSAMDAAIDAAMKDAP